MSIQPQLICNLCGGHRLYPLFSEFRHGHVYTSYYCRNCDVYQTLGDIDPISPDYIGLEEIDLDPAHRFLQTAHKLPAFKQWKTLIKSHLGKPISQATVLDIGCGIGGFLDYAKSLGFSTYGFDASKAHVAEARRRHKKVRQAIDLQSYFEQLDELPHIHFVTLWDVFEHVREPVQLLNQISEVLKYNNGILFISVPSGAVNPIKVRIASIRNRPIGLIPWEHVFYYTPKSLRCTLEKAGFEVLRIGGIKPYVRHPMTSHEVVRRAAHHVLRNTPYALQLYVLARPEKSQDNFKLSSYSHLDEDTIINQQ